MDIVMFESQLNCSADVPGSVTFSTQAMCKIITITWNALPDDPCPITGYVINVQSNTIPVPAAMTSWDYRYSAGACGKTLAVTMHAMNSVGSGSTSSRNQNIICEGKRSTISSAVQELLCKLKCSLYVQYSILFAVNLLFV